MIFLQDNKPMIVNCGNLPPKNIKDEYLQHALCVDLIDLPNTTNTAYQTYQSHTISMIDSSAGYLKLQKQIIKLQTTQEKN